MKYSPILLFVYNRPYHTKRTIESLLKNGEAKNSEIRIYSDGPKSEVDSDGVRDVRNFLQKVKGFQKVTIIEREHNMGLAESIIHGVTEMLELFDRVIVLEDDMVVSKYFLNYMNQALELYCYEPKVACVHAWNYPLTGVQPQTFFLRGADCWGWGTWRRAWNIFERDGQKLLHQIQTRNLVYEFDRKGAYPFTEMLKEQILGKNNSWAIRWYASAFLKDMFCLHPGKPLLQNIGLDGSGTHSGKEEHLSLEVIEEEIFLEKIEIAQNETVLQEIKKFLTYSGKTKHSFRNLLKWKVKRFLNILKGMQS
ncbi:glycosyltransferase, group 2 family protein [Leptospira yanagawae serovar Saopaulo str. Sao Paulo = ATCC 700523]|uniref:Glycosyltransferase, group 2 family protein n=1 Tax=Leptospira yanagawae serovar Saopaulo str. Sao Paulo = ATCC 700523 TaxID=1249483 RepID=A0A5E8HA55_9LEPT|nr:glycosyltransferase [Leptospira yanagawae]EOQ88044.1 glycosyltransferase, group 2 family protein [Leptospira yanagawae serovar Saopaulo str. Sao Paulo = ATCC 700523]